MLSVSGQVNFLRGPADVRAKPVGAVQQPTRVGCCVLGKGDLQIPRKRVSVLQFIKCTSPVACFQSSRGEGGHSQRGMRGAPLGSVFHLDRVENTHLA